MKELTNLYLLVFPEKEIIKIGKADDIHKRIDHLKKCWGEVDYDASYSLTIETEYVFKLEKSLHFMLSNYAVIFDDGEGKTEFFSIDALEQVLNHIRLYLSSNDNLKALKKGLLKPIIQTKNKLNKRTYKTRRLRNKIIRLLHSMRKNNDNLDMVLRLITFLMHFQSRIPFQYDIKDSIIYLRIKYERIPKRKIADLVMSSLSFQADDFNGYSGVSLCSAAVTDDVLQFNIRLIDAEDDFRNSYLVYISNQIESAFRRLPNRSIAATNKIPQIDEIPVIHAS